MKVLQEIVSDHPSSKGCSMKITRYTKKELQKFHVQPYDTCRIEWTSMFGTQIDVFMKPSELLLFAQLSLSAYVAHIEDIGDWTDISK